MVYDGDKWALRDRTETLQNIFDDGRNFLIVRNNDLKEKYTDSQKRTIRKFERFDNATRYALLISIRTPTAEVELYSAIENQIAVAVEV